MASGVFLNTISLSPKAFYPGPVLRRSHIEGDSRRQQCRETVEDPPSKRNDMSVSARKSDNGLFQRMKIALGWRRCKVYLPKFVASRKAAMMGIYGLFGLLFADQLIWTRIGIDLGCKFLFINLPMSCLLGWDRARSMWFMQHVNDKCRFYFIVSIFCCVY